MESWLIIPGAISLYWISSPHVTKWNREEMEIGRIEKGLARNNQFSSSYQNICVIFKIYAIGIAKIIPSTLSRRPPCPGIIEPLFLNFERRLNFD